MKKYIEKDFKETEIGKIPQDWEIKEIGEIINSKYFLNGGAFKSKELKSRKKNNDELPVLKIGNIIKNTNLVSFKNNCQFHNIKNYESKIVNEGLAIALTGATVGKAGWIREKCLVNQRVLVIKQNDILKFISFFILSNDFYKYAQNFSLGSVQGNLSPNQVMEYKIALPPLQEQKNIAKILGDLDAKIENNNEQNEIMEEIGKTIFKHWFVDFEYENYKTKGGKMIWNANLEKEIPENWEVGKLENELFFLKGVEVGSKNYNTKNKGQPFIRVGNLTGFRPEKKFTEIKTKIHCKPEDVLVSFDGSLGFVKYGFEGIYSSGIRKVFSKNKNCFSNAVIYFLMKSNYIQQKIKIYEATRTTLAHASGAIKEFYFFKENEALKNFNKKMKPFFEKMLENQKENEILKEMRDTLLPKLIKGEIRIK